MIAISGVTDAIFLYTLTTVTRVLLTLITLETFISRRTPSIHSINTKLGYSYNNNNNIIIIIEIVLRGWPHGQHESCIPYRGGFSTGDRFEFGSVDQQVRNRGINCGCSYLPLLQTNSSDINDIHNVSIDNSRYMVLTNRRGFRLDPQCTVLGSYRSSDTCITHSGLLYTCSYICNTTFEVTETFLFDT